MHVTERMICLLLLSMPVYTFAGVCTKPTLGSLECTEVSPEELLATYKKEPYLILRNIVWTNASSQDWVPSTYTPVNTLKVTNAELSEEALKKFLNVENTHISVIDVSNSKISLQTADFLNYKVLATLNLVNSVQQLPEKLTLAHLRELDLSNNENLDLPKIEANRLVYLNVSGSKKIGSFEFLASVPLLEELDLSYCDLSTIEHIPKMDNLKKLWLQGNKLSTVNQLQMPTLQLLSLEKNDFKTIGEDDFSGVKLLESLYISDNSISLMENPFKSNRELKHVELSNNALDKLPADWFSNVPELETLRLDNNYLVELPTLPENANSLRDLYLNGNTISHLNKGFFEKTPYLAILSLNGNQLQFVEEGLSPLSSLNKLYLKENFLEVNEDTFARLKKLKYMDLSYNHLNISLAVFAKNLQLRDLNLSHNSIKEICPASGLPKQIRNLDVQNNQIEKLGCLRNLNYLQIQQNPLICNSELQEDLKFASAINAQINSPLLMRLAANGREYDDSVMDDGDENWMKMYADICPNGPSILSLPKIPKVVTQNLPVSSDDSGSNTENAGDTDDDNDSDYEEENSNETTEQSAKDAILSISSILKFKNGIMKYDRLQFWITVSYVLLGLSIAVLIINVVVMMYRRRTQQAAASVGPYKKLSNDVYKDTTHLVDEQKSGHFLSVSFKDKKLSDVLSRFGFQNGQNAYYNRESTDSQAKMIPDANV